jgi:tRNA(Ile)-lysidine synthase
MNSTGKTVYNSIETRLVQAGVQSGERICVAYSGGPDSTALLTILKLLSEVRGFNICAAYIEHGLRPEIERRREIALITAVCGQLEVPLYVMCFPPGYIQERASEAGGIESAARSVRYDFLERVRAAAGCRWIATGHTRDDQTETLIMRFFQGAGVEGLTGMRSCDPPLLRPMLGVSKNEAETYLRESQLPFSVDSTNRSLDYLRNRIRQSLVPLVLELFPGMEDSLEQLSIKMSAAAEELERTADEEIQMSSDGNEASCPHELFFKKSLHVRTRAIYNLYNTWFTGPVERLPYRFVLNLCSSPAAEERHQYGEGHGIRMEKLGTRLFWSRVVVQEIKKSYLYMVKPGFISIDNTIRLVIQTETTKGVKKNRDGSLHIWSADAFSPCIIRSRREGDTIDTGTGRKRVKDLMSGKRLADSKKCRTLIVEDRRGILAAVEAGFGFTAFISAILKDTADCTLCYRLDFS